MPNAEDLLSSISWACLECCNEETRVVFPLLGINFCSAYVNSHLAIVARLVATLTRHANSVPAPQRAVARAVTPLHVIVGFAEVLVVVGRQVTRLQVHSSVLVAAVIALGAVAVLVADIVLVAVVILLTAAILILVVILLVVVPAVRLISLNVCVSRIG